MQYYWGGAAAPLCCSTGTGTARRPAILPVEDDFEENPPPSLPNGVSVAALQPTIVPNNLPTRYVIPAARTPISTMRNALHSSARPVNKLTAAPVANSAAADNTAAH